MRTPVTVTALLALVLSGALTGCSGSGEDTDERADCTPDRVSTTYRALVDDKGVLPADNWVPVVKAAGPYRPLLAAFDAATLGLSGADLAAIVEAQGSQRTATVQAAVSDLPEAGSGAGGRRTTLAVPPGGAGEGVGAYYDSALRRAGRTVAVRELEVGAALAAVRSGEVDAAVVGLADLGAAVGAEVQDGDASTQVQTVATAAFEGQLALGATASASGTPRVLVSDAVEAAASAATLSELAAACDAVTIAGQDTDPAASGAAKTLAAAYGFEVGDDSESAVAVVAAP